MLDNVANLEAFFDNYFSVVDDGKVRLHHDCLSVVPPEKNAKKSVSRLKSANDKHAFEKATVISKAYMTNTTKKDLTIESITT